jgi:signal transduction histidine kinase
MGGVLTLSDRSANDNDTYRNSNSALRRYAVALAVTVVALLVRRLLHPYLGDSLPYVTLFPAVAFSAWLCGVGPSIFAMLAGLAGARYWFLEPPHTLSIPSAPQAIGAVVFLVACGLMVAIGEIVRRNNEELREAQDDLEERVVQRTAELDTANQSLGELTARLLKLQDEERRRIARELHDSVGQTLAALSMNLSAIGGDIARLAKTASTVTDSAALVADMTADIRTISYLLHPPLLDEAGLSSALRWYIEGFADRSRIKVDLKVPEDFGRLPRDLETAIFRVVQECLTNIHRHSESTVARVRVANSGGDVRVEVEDEGKGIAPEKQLEIMSTGLPGVGMRGMRERLRQLGGSLEIKSAGEGKGTVVVARLPIAEPAPEIPSAMAAGAGG